MKVLAAIFDLDGTIIDSEREWKKSFEKVLLDLGVSSGEEYPGSFGVSALDNWMFLIRKYGIKTTKTPEELEVLTYIEYERLIPEINLREGVIDLISNLKDSGIEIALATAVSWEIAEKVLKSLGLTDLFDSITTGDEILNQKPDPEIFIKVADKISLGPNDCLVFEDSEAGVKAAKEAGMKVIAIDPSGENTNLDEADLVVGGYSEVTPKAITEL
jgi:HAD superfamily hydrolase (TIGR01509 family)